jgi:single-strand DNA-binding protein
MASFNFNKVILGGRLTSDVELKQTPQGIAVCSFSVAVNRKTKQGEDQKADFINCQAWRSTAEFISKYFKKGSSICLVGSIQTRSWTDNNNNKRYATEVIADEAYFVDSKAENDAPSFATQPTPNFEEVSGDEDLPF